MNFALLGGDDRTVRLCALLRADGHRVRPFALERALPDCTECAAEALDKADCAILPLPAGRDGALNAPYSSQCHAFGELLESAPRGLTVCAGKAEEELRSVCRRRGLALRDYFLREDFTLNNAELTAEGALGLLLAGERALRGSRVLVVGFGRIGRRLCAKLLPLGVQVTAAARGSADRTLAELWGCRAIRPEEASSEHWDAVVNTVPATLFGAAELADFGDARLIELASPPYGFDPAAAAALGKPIVLASGLPGKTAPVSAAAAIRDTIYAMMEEG